MKKGCMKTGRMKQSGIRQPLLSMAAGVACCFGGMGLAPLPAEAVDRLQLRLPVMEMTITLDIAQVRTAAELIQANPDLQELDRAGEGAVLRLLNQLLTAPLPEQTGGVAEQMVGHPLLEQALVAASELVEVEGLPTDTSGRMVSDALAATYRDGQPTVLGLLQNMPGESITLNLQALAFYAQRLQNNWDDARQLVQQGTPAVPAPSSLLASAATGWTREQLSLSVVHRPQPISLTVVKPTGAANGRLVVISHGLWDDPASFEGWGRLLASQGYTVLLPRHPGSDSQQQKAMLLGDQPPPGPEELRLRPLDVQALLDGIEAGSLLPGTALNTSAVAVVGHSWGAVSALQLGGLGTTSRKLKDRCQDPRDPERNLSWILQCSWLTGAEQGSLADPRVTTVVAVSPPLMLLFDETSAPSAQAKALFVSGTSDWVVPPDPEAVTPLRRGQPMARGHRLVLVSGGDHFNLWAPADQADPPVLGPLILAWIHEQLGVSTTFTFSAGRWGSSARPLVDVTSGL
jgi:predicted dienelactone hydrolase